MPSHRRPKSPAGQAKPKKSGVTGKAEPRTSRTARLRILGAASLILAAALAAASIARAAGPTRVALSGLEAAEAAAFRLAFEKSGGPRGSSRVSVDVGSRSRFFSRPDIVVQRSGAAIPAATPLPASIANRILPSLRSSVDGGRGAEALPLLIDHFEIAWNLPRFEALGLGPPSGEAAFRSAAASHATASITGAAASRGSVPAVLFAGGDDETLLLLVSALSEAMAGADGYAAAAQAIRDGARGERLLGVALGQRADGSPIAFSAVMAELRSWKARGLLHGDWAALEPADVRSLMEAGLSFMVFQPLSFHRTIPYQTIFDYDSGAFPSFGAAGKRAVVAPVTAARLYSGGRRLEAAIGVLGRLAGAESMYELSKASGKAPAIAASRVPDVQAGRALAWAASAYRVVPGFYLDCFADEQAAREFAEELRAAINE